MELFSSSNVSEEDLKELHAASNILNESGFALSVREYENLLNRDGKTLVYDPSSHQSYIVKLSDVR